MNEAEFQNALLKELQDVLESYEVSKKEALLYKLQMNPNGEIEPSNYQHPTRGNLAFETDLLIKNKKIPLVVLELKYGGFSTHDVLTYSIKALKHKEVYPYLRYGLVIGGVEKLDRKFFIHNVGFDFALAIKNLNTAVLLKTVKNQISYAEKLASTLSKGMKATRYESKIDIVFEQHLKILMDRIDEVKK